MYDFSSDGVYNYLDKIIAAYLPFAMVLLLIVYACFLYIELPDHYNLPINVSHESKTSLNYHVHLDESAHVEIALGSRYRVTVKNADNVDLGELIFVPIEFISVSKGRTKASGELSHVRLGPIIPSALHPLDELSLRVEASQRPNLREWIQSWFK